MIGKKILTLLTKKKTKPTEPTTPDAAGSVEQFAEPKRAIRRPRRKLSQHNKPWTTGEDRFIQANYRDLTAKEIADHLGRTSASINQRKSSLGLRKHGVLVNYKPAAFNVHKEGQFRELYSAGQDQAAVKTTMRRVRAK